MKLEFIKNINGYDEHAVRLSDFTSAQAKLFCKELSGLTANAARNIDLLSLDFIEPVNCRLTLRTSLEDVGIYTTDHVNFYCDLTVKGYLSMIELLRPFCFKESKGYQWLYDIDIPIGFLFSAGKDMPAKD